MGAGRDEARRGKEGGGGGGAFFFVICLHGQRLGWWWGGVGVGEIPCLQGRVPAKKNRWTVGFNVLRRRIVPSFSF